MSQRGVAVSHSPGFLGSTSFVATIRANSGAEDADPDEMMLSGNIDKKSLELGIKALMSFPNREASFALNKWYLESYTQMGFHKPTIYVSLQAFWDTFGSLLDEPRKVENMENIATVLSFNGRKSIERPDDPRDWVAVFTGPKTRWETLGTLFVGFGYACISLPDSDLKVMTGGAAVNRANLLAEMKECVEACVELCRYSLDNVVCSLLYRHMLFESVVSGDTGESLICERTKQFSDPLALSTWRLKSQLVGIGE
jgi:hypothetical protein